MTREYMAAFLLFGPLSTLDAVLSAPPWGAPRVPTGVSPPGESPRVPPGDPPGDTPGDTLGDT